MLIRRSIARTLIATSLLIAVFFSVRATQPFLRGSVTVIDADQALVMQCVDENQDQNITTKEYIGYLVSLLRSITVYRLTPQARDALQNPCYDLDGNHQLDAGDRRRAIAIIRSIFRPTGGSCGNGSIEVGEQCDDANIQAHDGCSPTCQYEGFFFCRNTSPTSPSQCYECPVPACVAPREGCTYTPPTVVPGQCPGCGTEECPDETLMTR